MKMAEETVGDSEIRDALSRFISNKYKDKTSTFLIEELGLCRGQVRVDFVVVERLLHGFEIKSDKDDLRRLTRQVDFYSRVLDKATIVVGTRHLIKMQNSVPDWWGILCYEHKANGLHFNTIRLERKNPQRDPRSLVELLWLDEAIALLEGKNAAMGVRSKPRRYVWDKVCRYFEVEEIAKNVREVLKERVMTRALQQPS
ncbi:hypothetical protein CEE37_06820 [candidate division LCP-89 bacterium B3_LCP]|uniref:Sce7726 family protein n=1 Tax=candidate division LCP-89 bacterium B3_LCP TaxID=2012998 RepID=A0A532V0D4_UNCL8|nr:MAG: hypothetical protein CEE37_06820 [candidate division LCP-89 bacterium B3_LCP]